MFLMKKEDALHGSAYYAWLICFTASLFFFYEIVQLTVFNTISFSLAKFFSLSTLDIGHLSSLYLYSCALFLLPAGVLLDKFSTRKILVTTSGLCTLGVYLIAIASSVETVAIGRSLTGVGNAFAFLGTMRLASRWFPVSKVALVMGLTVTIAMLGGIVSQTPFAFLLKTLGFQRAILFNALVGLIIMLLIMFIVRDTPINKSILKQHNRLQKIPLHFWKNLKTSSLNKQNCLCGLYTGLLNLPVMTLGALWGNFYLTQGRGFSITQAGNITSLIFFGLIIGAPLMGWFSDRIKSRRKLMLIDSTAIFVTIIAIIYIFDSVTVISLLFLLMGILSGAQVLSYPIVSESNPPHLESTSLGLVAIIVNLIGAGSQILFGWLIHLKWNGHSHQGLSIHTLSAYQFSLIMMPLAFFISLLVALCIHDRCSA